MSTALAALLIIFPLLGNAYLPLEDLPNHIARRYIMSGVDPALAEQYRLQGGLATNSAVDLIWQIHTWFASVTSKSVIAFSHWTMGFAMLGLVGSVMILHRTLHGRWSPWPLLSGLLVYNANILWGFENYVVTLPLGIVGFALWIMMRNSQLWLRLLMTSGVVIILYLGHVLVMLAYAILVFGYEAGHAWQAKRHNRWPDLKAADWASLSVVGASCLAYLIASLVGPEAGYGSASDFGRWSDHFGAFLSPFGSTSHMGSMLDPLVMQSVALLSIALVLLLLDGKLGISLRRATHMNGPILLLGLAALIMPFKLSGVYFVNLRFPVLLFATLIAAYDIKIEGRRGPMLATFLTVALLSIIAVRATIFDRGARAYSEQITQIAELVPPLHADMPAGAKILPVVNQLSEPFTIFHSHSAAYLTTFSGAFVPTLFVAGSHRLSLAPGLEHLSAPQPNPLLIRLLDAPPDRWDPANDEGWSYASNWKKDYTHIVLIGSVPDKFAKKYDLRQIASEKNVALFALNKGK